jgi:hypothetical protein
MSQLMSTAISASRKCQGKSLMRRQILLADASLRQGYAGHDLIVKYDFSGSTF